MLDLNPEELGDYAKGVDFDLDFTLLVPAIKLHDRNQPITLDMRQSAPCHSWLSLRLCDPAMLARWRSCCEDEGQTQSQGSSPNGHHVDLLSSPNGHVDLLSSPNGHGDLLGSPNGDIGSGSGGVVSGGIPRGVPPSLQSSPQSLDGCYFSPALVTDWFWEVVNVAVEELRRNPQRGIPVPDRVERNGPVTTLVLTAGTSRVLYDLLPVVSFRGWPAVAQGWLTTNHFWDGKITEEEAISGFYLLPCCSPRGGRPDREWRLAFSRR